MLIIQFLVQMQSGEVGGCWLGVKKSNCFRGKYGILGMEVSLNIMMHDV